jgi:hypothetical protein
MDKWSPLALFVSANLPMGSKAIVNTIFVANSKTETFNGKELKDNQGLRIVDLRALYKWLNNPGIVLTKNEVNKRCRLMKTKLYLYYLVASPEIPPEFVHPTISMCHYAKSRTLAFLCLCFPCPVPKPFRIPQESTVRGRR